MKYIIAFFMVFFFGSAFTLIAGISGQNDKQIHSSLIVLFSSLICIGIILIAIHISEDKN